MGMRADIRTQLAADAGVAAIVGTRIWWMQIPQVADSKPALTYRVVEGPRVPTLEGNSTLRVATVEVVAWAADAAVAESLANAAVAAMLAGPLTAVQTAEADIIEEREGLEGGLPGIVLEFTVGHSTED
jgi:hypothetical protein